MFVGKEQGRGKRTLKSGIAVSDAVGGQDEDSLKVLQLTEKDGDESISGYVFGVALLEEDVRFIQ